MAEHRSDKHRGDATHEAQRQRSAGHTGKIDGGAFLPVGDGIIAAMKCIASRENPKARHQIERQDGVKQVHICISLSTTVCRELRSHLRIQWHEQ